MKIREIAISPRLKNVLRAVRDMARRIFYYGKKRYCPVCGKSFRQFCMFGVVPREDAQCVYCGALERHRFLWLYLLRKTNLFDGMPKKMLHFAAIRCFANKLREMLKEGYLTADICNPNAMVKMDITNIEYPDKSFDVICCSHVLEHVQDDIKALRELFRVLKNNGWAVILVPITTEKTVDDPSIVEDLERLKAFGQKDHVRRCGPDYIDRLHEAGFSVDVIKVNDLVQNSEAVRMGLTAASGEIFYCTK
ncbi:MAG: methyltransferase domain-containing protein [Candidatus Theseobacter exili]|nr:methyltransferase domain-containing protein [Candidatus Theseobacter exili]